MMTIFPPQYFNIYRVSWEQIAIFQKYIVHDEIRKKVPLNMGPQIKHLGVRGYQPIVAVKKYENEKISSAGSASEERYFGTDY